ncbi:unnamed protein product [Amoebophrya sp. A120]|nr:unnamed protein product [Amoebophrya sp. A120]|eukprot:GSA120T00022353001.1
MQNGNPNYGNPWSSRTSSLASTTSSNFGFYGAFSKNRTAAPTFSTRPNGTATARSPAQVDLLGFGGNNLVAGGQLVHQPAGGRVALVQQASSRAAQTPVVQQDRHPVQLAPTVVEKGDDPFSKEVVQLGKSVVKVKKLIVPAVTPPAPAPAGAVAPAARVVVQQQQQQQQNAMNSTDAQGDTVMGDAASPAEVVVRSAPAVERPQTSGNNRSLAQQIHQASRQLAGNYTSAGAKSATSSNTIPTTSTTPSSTSGTSQRVVTTSAAPTSSSTSTPSTTTTTVTASAPVTYAHNPAQLASRGNTGYMRINAGAAPAGSSLTGEMHRLGNVLQTGMNTVTNLERGVANLSQGQETSTNLLSEVFSQKMQDLAQQNKQVFDESLKEHLKPISQMCERILLNTSLMAAGAKQKQIKTVDYKKFDHKGMNHASSSRKSSPRKPFDKTHESGFPARQRGHSDLSNGLGIGGGSSSSSSSFSVSAAAPAAGATEIMHLEEESEQEPEEESEVSRPPLTDVERGEISTGEMSL